MTTVCDLSRPVRGVMKKRSTSQTGSTGPTWDHFGPTMASGKAVRARTGQIRLYIDCNLPYFSEPIPFPGPPGPAEGPGGPKIGPRIRGRISLSIFPKVRPAREPRIFIGHTLHGLAACVPARPSMAQPCEQKDTDHDHMLRRVSHSKAAHGPYFAWQHTPRHMAMVCVFWVTTAAIRLGGCRNQCYTRCMGVAPASASLIWL